jgi:hypothetical protein
MDLKWKHLPGGSTIVYAIDDNRKTLEGGQSMGTKGRKNVKKPKKAVADKKQAQAEQKKK